MKKIIYLLLTIFMLIPNIVKADTQALDLIDTIESINLEPSVSDYKETDDQVYIYLFRWLSCNHCHDAIEFFNEILPEYKDKIKMRSYETSANQDNYKLQEKVVSHFNIGKTGVPLIVIGENTFYGFSDDDKDKIKEAIDNVYNDTERYDMFDEMDKNHNPNSALYVLVPIAAICIIIFVFKLAKKENA